MVVVICGSDTSLLAVSITSNKAVSMANVTFVMLPVCDYNYFNLLSSYC